MQDMQQHAEVPVFKIKPQKQESLAILHGAKQRGRQPCFAPYPLHGIDIAQLILLGEHEPVDVFVEHLAEELINVGEARRFVIVICLCFAHSVMAFLPEFAFFFECRLQEVVLCRRKDDAKRQVGDLAQNVAGVVITPVKTTHFVLKRQSAAIKMFLVGRGDEGQVVGVRYGHTGCFGQFLGQLAGEFVAEWDIAAIFSHTRQLRP